MDLAKISVDVNKAIDDAISADLPEAEREAIVRAVQKGLAEASRQTQEHCKQAAVICCGPEADLAHKIQHEMDQKRDMLIANLMAMR